jgi:3-hydroxyacyl-CoA dehydrogenase
MRLIEIVWGRLSGDDVIADSMALAKRLGKVAVPVGNGPGFVGNRLFEPYLREAHSLVVDGARVDQVDAVLCDFGMAMGPFAVWDLVGLDIGRGSRGRRTVETSTGARPFPVARWLRDLGRFGRKAGRGWYRYDGEGREPVADPEVEELIAECARDSGIERRPIGSTEILERTVYALINEGAKVLEEKRAARAVDIDLIYVFGYGFPAYRGGPMWHADAVGLAEVHARVREFAKRPGGQWQVAPLLGRLAAAGCSFADWDKAESPH